MPTIDGTKTDETPEQRLVRLNLNPVPDPPADPVLEGDALEEFNAEQERKAEKKAARAEAKAAKEAEEDEAKAAKGAEPEEAHITTGETFGATFEVLSEKESDAVTYKHDEDAGKVVAKPNKEAKA